MEDQEKVNNFDLIGPEDSRHLTRMIDKSPIIQYKVSLRKSSNISSQVLLKTIWDKHSEESFVQARNEILATTKNHSTIGNWSSSLSNLEDPQLVFEKNVLCTNNCNGTPVNYYGLNIFVENFRSEYKVKELDNCFRNSKLVHNKEQVETKRCVPENHNKISNISDEPKVTFINSNSEKSKIIKNGSLPINNVSTEGTSTSNEFQNDEEEYKIHKSNIAKITFKTAREQLLGTNPALKRTLGASRKTQGKFISPMISEDKHDEISPIITDERVKHIDPKMIELIESEIIDRSVPIGWEDIAGLEMAKSVIQEAVVWPILRPDIFTGLRRPPKGILLFGPPGTGKTLIGKCVASQCHATFFSISASSLTSKWIGDGEKMVRALFAVARCHQPAVIFIDEIDSLLTQRSDTEHEATRRIKTEFLVQFDGAATGDDDRLLIVGATNRPQELDEAARRRLVKRLYIPLPDINARKQIICNLLRNESNKLKPNDVDDIATSTDGYSGADMKSLCSEAAMGPIRSLPLSQIVNIEAGNVRPVNVTDFKAALQRVRPSVSKDDLGVYESWNQTYGHGF